MKFHELKNGQRFTCGNHGTVYRRVAYDGPLSYALGMAQRENDGVVNEWDLCYSVTPLPDFGPETETKEDCQPGKIAFGDLKPGECFTITASEGTILVKTIDSLDSCNAVGIGSGETWKLGNSTPVNPVKFLW